MSWLYSVLRFIAELYLFIWLALSTLYPFHLSPFVAPASIICLPENIALWLILWVASRYEFWVRSPSAFQGVEIEIEWIDIFASAFDSLRLCQSVFSIVHLIYRDPVGWAVIDLPASSRLHQWAKVICVPHINIGRSLTHIDVIWGLDILRVEICREIFLVHLIEQFMPLAHRPILFFRIWFPKSGRDPFVLGLLESKVNSFIGICPVI